MYLRWIYIVFVLAFIPTPVYSQLVSLSKLESGKHNFRLGYVGNFVQHGMWLGGDRGFGDRTQVSTSASIFFDATDKTIDDIYQSSQIVHIIPLGSTGLDCFFFGDFGVFIDRDAVYYLFIDREEEKRRFISMLLGGGGGLSKTLGRFTPFVSLFYRHNVYTKKYELPYGRFQWHGYGNFPWHSRRDTPGGFLWSMALSIGAEIEITQHIDLTGRVELEYREPAPFGLDNFYFSGFSIGLSLH